MSESLFILTAVIGFIVLALAANQIGQFFTRYRLPLISGFLAAGILVGPYGLKFLSRESVISLHFIDQLSLAFIALAAGNELHLEEIRSRLKSIAWITLGLVVTTFVFCSLTIFGLSTLVPFSSDMALEARIAVAILAGAILVARSPSSAIAVVKELRAKGAFTATVLGVTVIMDVVVIVLFGLGATAADSLITGVGLSGVFVAIIAGQLLLSLLFGMGFGWLLHGILGLRFSRSTKKVLVVLLGFSVYASTEAIKRAAEQYLGVHIAPEPLLVCVIGGLAVANFSRHRPEFSEIIHDAGPPVYIAFFTLTGASLALDALLDVWLIGAILFFVRLGSLFLGSFLGGVMARDESRLNRLYGLAFVTQAGVGLGLAKSVALAFPAWGPDFAALIIAIIVVNQLVGPPLFKWAIVLAGESHARGIHVDHAGHQVVIFGLEDRSLALANQLRAHGWQPRIAERRGTAREELPDTSIEISHVSRFNIETLNELGVNNAETIVCMLSDEENQHICQLAFENFGTPQMVVRLNRHENSHRFAELGAIVVDPRTAMVHLLDHMVRSPLAASVMLGMEEGQDIVEIEVRDPALDGKLLRELRLPADTLVLSVSRDGHMLVSHGYTPLRMGDHVTIIGSDDSLEQVTVLFEE
jgi:Trk K+ transport system NAD-binding subunit/Kef-type K+ transport system membrane component KefB